MSPRESSIQNRVRRELKDLGWHVEVMSCNAYQKGIPDLYCFWVNPHDLAEELHRWVDIKRPNVGALTKAQVQKWPLWEEVGLGVWILTGDEPDYEKVLLGSPNWRDWWKPRYEKWLLRDPADLLREMDEKEECDFD